MATAVEPVTNQPPVRTELSAAKDSTTTTQTATTTNEDRVSAQKMGERIALSDALTKAPSSKARTIGELFNPFAPVEPKSESRWLERTAWSSASTAAAGNSRPVEMRHESRFGLTIAVR